VTRDGPLLDTTLTAFTHAIDRAPAHWRSNGSHGPTSWRTN